MVVIDRMDAELSVVGVGIAVPGETSVEIHRGARCRGCESVR